MKFWAMCCITIFLFFLITSTQAATFYVDGSATGATNGTSWANAWKTLTQVSGVQAGDTVYISGGPSGSSQTYVGGNQASAGYPRLWIPASGSSGNPITYKIGQDSLHNGTAYFDGANTVYWIGYNPNVSNVVISGDAGDGNRHFVPINYTEGAVLDGDRNITLSYIDFSHIVAGVITGGGINGLEIDHCYFYVGPTADRLSYASFVGTTWNQNKFHHNTVYLPRLNSGIGADGLQWVGTGYSIYDNNIIGYTTNYSGGQHQDGWQDTGNSSYIKIYNNYFQDIGNYALFADGYYGGFSHLWIYNNVVVLRSTALQDNDAPGAIVVGADGGAIGAVPFSDVTIMNNTVVDYFYGSGSGCHGCFRTPGSITGDGSSPLTNTIIKNNLAINSGNYQATNEPSVVVSNNVTITAASATSQFTHYATNDAANDYHLLSAATSLINTGADLSAYLTTDKDGVTRPQGAGFDIGAYEYQSGAAPTCTSFTYSGWSTCTDGTQTRTIIESSPSGCTGGTPVTTQSCTNICTDFNYSDWNSCDENTLTQTRTIITSSPSGCTGGNPTLTQSCTITCTDFNYSDWSTCTSNSQTRTITSSTPSGCSGGTPITTQSCTAATTQGNTGGGGSGGGGGGAPLTTSTTTTSNTIACNKDSDCGKSQFVYEPYCTKNQVLRNYNTYTCTYPGTPNAHCTAATSQIIIATCDANAGCSNGACNATLATILNEAAQNPAPVNETVTSVFTNPVTTGGIIIAIAMLAAGMFLIYRKIRYAI